MTIQAKIIKVTNISKHPNADRLDILRVGGEGGFPIVVGKEEFREGDFAIYFYPDSILPDSIISKMNQKVKLENRFRAVKIRGEISEGLCIRPEVLLPIEMVKEDQDVTEYLGIKKYEPPEENEPNTPSKKMKRRPANPNFKMYTHIERIERYPRAIQSDETVVATMKMHGQNARFGVCAKPEGNFITNFWRKITGTTHDFIVGSHLSEKRDINDRFVKLAKKKNLEPILHSIQEIYRNTSGKKLNIILFGELIGPNIQKGYDYGLTETNLVFFNLMVDGKYVDWEEFISICTAFDLIRVKEIYRGPFKDLNFNLADEVDEFNGKKYVREGIVIKTIREQFGHHGRTIFKKINPKYLLNRQNTEKH
jgi:RNA ligase (TIGR02306 family)